MGLLKLLKKLPLDFGQAEQAHKTKGKLIALEYVEKPSKPSRALDVGCRDGYFSELLKRKGYSVISIDIEPKYKYAKVIDANKPLPFPSGTFDLIWCSEVIEHLKNPLFSLAEFRRVLKPGGRIIITTPNSGCWIYRLLSLFGIPPRKAQNPDHKHFFTLSDIKKLFSSEAKVYGFFPYAIVKFKIQRGISFLTPTFVVIEDKSQ